MNLFTVHISEDADKFLEKLDCKTAERIISRLKRLGENPFPSDSKFITREGTDRIHRFRIGDYRALYKVKNEDQIVLISKIDKRPKVYQ